MAAARLYLLLPPAAEPEALAPRLAAAVAGDGVDCVLLHPDRLAEPGEAALDRAIRVLRPVVQDRGIAFLVAGRADLAARLDCDGAHVEADSAPSYAEARRLVGAHGIVGVGCGTSRHDAMVEAEQGADYVAFGRPGADAALLRLTLARIAWWAELMEVPAVGFGAATPAAAADMGRAGADFVAVDAPIWQHAEGPAAGVVALMTALRAAAVEPAAFAEE